MRRKNLLLLLILFIWTGQAWGESLEPAGFPSLVSSIRIKGPLLFCGEEVPLRIQEVRERLEKEFLLSLWDRPQVILWLKRSHRYFPHIEEMLRKDGMPEDLKYLAIAESALRPHAGSKKGAMGFWQFMVASGRKHGLVINDRIDERRNLFASTGAAIKYLKGLHETFGSWTLAAAGYNMGEEGLMAEILEQETKDYYQLYLPLETQRFIFRILSVKLIFSDPEGYGFKLAEEDFYPPLAFDRIQVECFQEIPIRIIAQAAKTHFKVIKDLNPEIRGHYLTSGSHQILIPEGASKGFQARYQSLVEKFLTAQKERVYIIKKGDTLSSIAEKFGIPLTSLIIWNRIDLRRSIHPGDRLIIYQKEFDPSKMDFDREKPGTEDSGEER
ncbi:MAG: transglycosylase SLT domain-containing protein [Pseudomonadota bacterium]